MTSIRMGGAWYPLDMGQIECILPDPKVISVPKAPPGVAGLVLYKGRAVPIRGEGGAPLALLTRETDGTISGMLAEELGEGPDGEGENIDQIYG